LSIGLSNKSDRRIGTYSAKVQGASTERETSHEPRSFLSSRPTAAGRYERDDQQGVPGRDQRGTPAFCRRTTRKKP